MPEKKEYDWLKEVVVEIANILLDEYSTKVEAKTRKKVERLRELVNPFK